LISAFLVGYPSSEAIQPRNRVEPMFHHTVLLSLAPMADSAFFERFVRFEAQVVASCAGVIRYRLLPNDAPSRKSFGHVLVSAFESRAAFVDYDRCALHTEIKAFLGPFVADLVVADADDTTPPQDCPAARPQ